MHETRPSGNDTLEIRTRGVLLATAGLVTLLVVVFLGTWALLKAILPTGPSPAASAPSKPVFAAEPALQVSPRQDLAKLRAEEDRLLHSGGWIDQEAGIARISIDQAMALLVDRARQEREKGR